MQDFWTASGYRHLDRATHSPGPRGWLKPTDGYLRTFIELPELALVEESCSAEVALHERLLEAPAGPVARTELEAIEDADARDNYATFLAFRDTLLSAGTLEACYLGLVRGPRITTPPAFIGRLVEAIVRHLLDDSTDAFEARAGEMLFRPQRVNLTEGRMLAADLATVELLGQTGGFGDLGRLLVQSNAPMAPIEMKVLGPDNAVDYWAASDRHSFALDLTHEVETEIGHGLVFTTTRTHSGLKALSRCLEKWLAHLLGLDVSIFPRQRIDDDAWRWHVGLDAEAMAILNDLYDDRTVDDERMRRLVSLFRLEFRHPAEMRADVAGKPVYLAIAMNANGELRLKPQNLLLNLPLSRAM